MDENADVTAVKPLVEVRHSLKHFVRGSHLVSSIILDQVWATRGQHGGRHNDNNNNCRLMEFVNIVITKVFIFVNVFVYRPY